MRIKFLETTPSDAPEYPFQAGQIITVQSLTAQYRRWVKDGRAVTLDDEAADLGEPLETAAVGKAKSRGAR